MSAPGSLKGTLLMTADERVVSARIGYQPIADPAHALRARRPLDAIAMIDLLYGVCRHAHGLAARRALGIDMNAEQEWRLECATKAESARESLLQIGWHWPRLLSELPMPSFYISGAIALVQAAIEQSRESLFDLIDQQAQSVADFFNLAISQADPILGSDTAVASLRCDWLEQMLASIESASHKALPLPADVGVSTPRDCYLHTVRGYFSAMSELREIAGLDEIPSDGRERSIGTASVETSRGRLTHTVLLGSDNQIESYDIDAPTSRRFSRLDWTKQGLTCLKDQPIQQAEKTFGNWLAALDPCGGVAVERGAAHA